MHLKEKYRIRIKKHSNYYLDFIFILVISYVSLQHIGKLNNIIIVDDQLGYWGIAAKIAGYDWSDMVSTTSYYGFGYPLLLVPLLKLGLEPDTIYHFSIILNAFLLILSYVFARISIRKIFDSMKTVLQSIICFLTIMYGNNIVQSNTAWTETLLYMLFWLSFYLVILIGENITPYRMAVLTCICMYMYAVHQRSLGVIMALGIILAIKIFGEHDIKKYIKIIITIGCVVVILSVVLMYIKHYLINNLWSSVDADVLSINDYSGQFGKIKGLIKAENLYGFFRSICGKIFYLLVATLFSGVLGFIYCTKQFWEGIVQGNSTKKDNRIVYIYCVLTVLAEMTLTAINMYREPSRIDVLVYGRYMEFVFGPLMMFGLAYLLQNNSIDKLICCFMLGLLLCTIIIEPIYENVKEFSFNNICATQLVQFFSDQEKWGREYLLYTIALLAIMLIALIYIILKRHPKAGILIMIITCLTFWNKNNYYSFLANDKWDTRFSENYVPIRDVLKENKISEITFLDSIVEVGNIHIDYDNYIKQLQFTLYDITIHRNEITDVWDMNLADNQWYVIEKGISEETAIRSQIENIVIDNDYFIVFYI